MVHGWYSHGDYMDSGTLRSSLWCTDSIEVPQNRRENIGARLVDKK